MIKKTLGLISILGTLYISVYCYADASSESRWVKLDPHFVTCHNGVEFTASIGATDEMSVWYKENQLICTNRSEAKLREKFYSSCVASVAQAENEIESVLVNLDTCDVQPKSGFFYQSLKK